MIDVVIPTRNRPELLADLVRNIHEATVNEHWLYLVMEKDDHRTIRAATGLDAVKVAGDFGTVGKAINAGYRVSHSPFMAYANDDVWFQHGWDAHALSHFHDPGAHILGLNDGHGDLLCFSMVRRSFIEEQSGVYDERDTIFHEGYRSHGLDTEFSFYAQLRGVWRGAPDAVIDHRHPRYGHGDPSSPNYRKTQEAINADLATYHRRWPEWDPERRMPPPAATVSPA